MDKKEKYVFRFNRMYRNPADFSYNLNRGMKEVGKEIDEEGLTFYAARHTMATIAFNETDIDKMTIGTSIFVSENDVSEITSSLRMSSIIHLQKTRNCENQSASLNTIMARYFQTGIEP